MIPLQTGRSLRRLATAGGAVLALVVGAAEPSWAAVSPSLPHTDWYQVGYPGAGATEYTTRYYLGIDPVAKAGQVPPNYFWMNNMWPVSGQVGYFGLQKRSVSPNKVAIFSWWGALDVYCSGVPNIDYCGPLLSEGTGYTARVGFNWQPGVNYDFRLWRGNYDAARNAYWWNLDIFNDQGVRLAPVGALLVPASYGGLNASTQLTEFFGSGSEAPNTCDQLPRVDTWFGRPRFNGVYPASGTIGVNQYNCPAETVWWGDGSSQRMGT